MRICFIGDSFVNGTGDDACLGWTGRICSSSRLRGLDLTLYNLGVRRDRSMDVAERWEREARARLKPEHVGGLVFSFGVNDCVFGPVPTSESLANARSILSKAAAWLPTLMIGPVPIDNADVNERTAHLSALFGDLCKDLSVPYLPVFDALVESEMWLPEVRVGDGAHPNSGGYSALAALVEGWTPWREFAGQKLGE